MTPTARATLGVMDTKYCPKCQETKSVDDFGKNKSKSDGLQTVCKLCMKGYNQRHYENNKEQYAVSARAYQKKLRAEVSEIKETTPCTDCGLFFPPYVMQFDHLGDKVKDVAYLVSRGVARAKILTEIAKCELVCANCHCVRTHKRRVASGQDEV